MLLFALFRIELWNFCGILRFEIGEMEAEMEVPQVGILLIALLYQKSPFLRTGFLSCLRNCCDNNLIHKVSKLNLLIDIIILQYAFDRFVGYFHILCLDFPLTDILYLF